MHRRPIIGIPTQTLQSLGGIPAEFPPSWVMSQRYIVTLTASGALPWMIPLVGDDEETLRGIYDELDGVFLPGGADIDPPSYGEERHPLCDRTDSARDHVELMLIRWAMADRKPVLGVCRGIQLINLAAGGTLYQDLADQYKGAIKHDYFPFGGAFMAPPPAERRRRDAYRAGAHPGVELAFPAPTSRRPSGAALHSDRVEGPCNA